MKRNRRLILILSLAAFAGVSSAMPAGMTRIRNGVEYDSRMPFRSATRSLENPETECVATEASFFYTGEFMSGAGGYIVILSNAGLDKKNPTHSGQMARLYVVADAPADPSNPKLPTGTFTAQPDDADFTSGYFVPYATDFLDVFPNPESPESGELVCYSWTSTGGTITIAESGDGYVVEADLDAVFNNGEEETENAETAKCKASFTGEVPYVNYYAYDPLPEDRTVEIKGVSGRFMDDGGYSISFYNVPLDEDGFIIGPGDLLNLECYVEPGSSLDLDRLCQTFTPVDFFEEGVVPGRFMKGIWYNMFGEIWVAYGTALSVFQEDGSTLTGLAADGTVTFSKADKEKEYTVVFDLVTPEGKTIKADWTGRLGDYIEDYTTGVDAVESVDADKPSIIARDGFIECPEGSQIYSLSGIRIENRNVQPGVYIVRCGDISEKVIMK